MLIRDRRLLQEIRGALPGVLIQLIRGFPQMGQAA